MNCELSIKTLIYALGLLLAQATVGCSSSDDDDAGADSAIAVVESNVFFPSQGGEGSIVVRAGSPLTVTSSADWCQTTVNGQTIGLTARANTTTSGRAAIITISSGGSSLRLTAQQRGIIYRFDHAARYIYGDTAVAVAMPISYDNVTTVEGSQPWLTATLDADTVRYSCLPNTTGQVRSAWVKVCSGEYADSFKVLQYDAATDILGRYRLAGTVASGSTVEYEGTLSYTGRTLYFRIPEQSWNIALTLDENEPTLYLKNTEYAGRFRTDSVNYYVSVLTAPLIDGMFQLALSSSYGMKAPLDYDPQLQTVTGRLQDDGSWAATGYVPNALLFWLATERTPTAANSAGYLQGIVDPYFYRIKN